MRSPRSSRPVRMLRADCRVASHRRAIATLLADYMQDPMGGAARPLTPHQRRAMLDGLAALPTSLVLLLFIAERPVGMAVCFRGFSTFNAAPLLNIHDLIVAREHRGNGLGRCLVREAERIAGEMRCCKVTLEVRRDNRIARKLYRSCGFSEGEKPMGFWTKPLPRKILNRE